jgi:hypothetical protein
MGHHLFIREGKGLAVRDFDVALLRHFLIEGARRIGNAQLAGAISGWEYQGPGVWMGIDERILSAHSPVFEAASEVAAELGDSIAVDYLNANAGLREAVWLKPRPTADVVETLRELQHHLSNVA